MSLALIGLVGGVITGLSPCILPVLPVILLSGGAQSARTDGTRTTGRRPYLVVAGLVTSFSALTLGGAAVLAALPIPQSAIRWVGLVALVLLGIGLIVPRVEALLEAPFVRIPQRSVGRDRGGFLLGLVLGTVYVPCAGPVLAAITIAGATGGVGGDTIVLTAGFALGTALTLLIFALAGRAVAERVLAIRRRQRLIRVIAGVAVVGLALALTFNVTGTVQRVVPDYTAALSHSIEKLIPATPTVASKASPQLATCVEHALYGAPPPSDGCGPAPEFAGVRRWLNTEGEAPVDLADLRGKVVLVGFWTFDCINCQHVLPYLVDWYQKYHGEGLEVIGVHTPEYSFEHDVDGVVDAARRYGINYPIAVDNDYATWSNYGVQAWPSMYLVDATGAVRHIAIGEGGYDVTENLIRTLLDDARHSEPRANK
ncbi:cytochrome c biogenesis protein DipZ [Micromonospora zamorensis]|uniref:cytochrome c biogenesis protein DipZ n=1 Tax=Micromonospora zamorensis TaxID=709883 RepID=UPI003CF6E482